MEQPKPEEFSSNIEKTELENNFTSAASSVLEHQGNASEQAKVLLARIGQIAAKGVAVAGGLPALGGAALVTMEAFSEEPGADASLRYYQIAQIGALLMSIGIISNLKLQSLIEKIQEKSK